jgi:hypothetical protein
VHQEHGTNAPQNVKEKLVIGFPHTCVEPQTVMIKMGYTLVAILAMHRVFGDTEFTDPTILHGFLLLWECRVSSRSIVVKQPGKISLWCCILCDLSSFTQMFGQMMVHGIYKACFVAIIRCSECACKEYQRAGYRSGEGK